jgi:GTP-binding protein
LKPQDRQLIDWVHALGLPLHILLTKTDKLSRGEAARTLAAVRRELARLGGVGVQLFSATAGLGVEEARGVLLRWYAGPAAGGSPVTAEPAGAH